MDEAQAIGQRVRSWRRYRGKSLEEVAGLAGISAGYLSLIERGLRPLDKLSRRIAIAKALDVSVADLSGLPHPPTDDEQRRAHATVPRIRLALIDTAAVSDSGRTLAEARVAVAVAGRLRDQGDYDELGELLPGLMSDLSGLVGDGEREAWRLAAELTGSSSTMLRNLGYLPDALIAAERSRSAAAEYGDPVLLAATAFFAGKALIPAGALTTAERSQVAAADEVAGLCGDDDRARQTYAALHLNAAWACSIAGRAEASYAHVDEAIQVATAVTGPDFTESLLGNGVSPADIEICRTSVAVELGDNDQAIRTAGSIDPSGVKSRARRATYFADLGRALSADRRRDADALRALRAAEDLTPQRVRASTSVRLAVDAMRSRARRSGIGRELELMASRLGAGD